MAPDIPNKPKSGGNSQRRRKRRAFASMPQPVSQSVPESAEAITSELQLKRLALMTRLRPDTWRFSLSKPNVMYALDDNTLRYIYGTLSLEYPFALLKRVIDVWKDQGEGDPLGLGMFGQPEGPSFLVRQVVAGYLLATEYDRDMQSDEDKDDSLPDVSESLMMELKKGLELMAGDQYRSHPKNATMMTGIPSPSKPALRILQDLRSMDSATSFGRHPGEWKPQGSPDQMQE